MDATRIGVASDGTIHAVAQPASAYILACTERPVTFPVEQGTPDRITCKRCQAAIAADKVRWRY